MLTMRRPSFLAFLFALTVPLVGACGTDDDGWSQRGVTVESRAPCVGQQAAVPASGAVERMFQISAEEVDRLQSEDRVDYYVRQDQLFARFSFASTLPAQPTTQELRSQFKYGYLEFELEQPARIGGHLQVLFSRDAIPLDAFDQLEAQDGKLMFRTSRVNPGQYARLVSIYDDDPRNDPAPSGDCVITDVSGECFCGVFGPPLTISLSGSLPL